MTNAYDSSRGNPTDRQRRKLYLLETYAADVFMIHDDFDRPRFVPASALGVYVGEAIQCCRCYRCGTLLTYETLTVDRIVPGCKGGTYRRTNIRPSCSDCATKTGNALKAALK